MSIETGNREMPKVFEYFPQMPNEIKLLMVKEMELCDRFRFARCSKTSRNLWAKVTRNEPCSLTVYSLEPVIQLDVQHGRYAILGREKEGFRWMFDNSVFAGSKSISCAKLSSTEVWDNKVDPSIDVIHFGIDYVEKVLEFYQNGIKKLHIHGSCTTETLINLDSIESFKNLEVLQVSSDWPEILYLVLSKLRNPLKKLNADLFNNRTNHINCDQLFQVQDELRWFHTDFDYPEFLRLSAKHVYINIGNLTEQDIFNFIKSWENGTYNGRIEKCEWDLYESTFDKRLLCQLFEIDLSESSIDDINIVQKGSGKNATLFVGISELEFSLNNQ